MTYFERAMQWYEEHTKHVDSLLKPCKWDSNVAFEPTGEDLNHPELWKPGHWRWFFASH